MTDNNIIKQLLMFIHPFNFVLIKEMKASLTYKIIIINLSGKIETSRRAMVMLLLCRAH